MNDLRERLLLSVLRLLCLHEYFLWRCIRSCLVQLFPGKLQAWRLVVIVLLEYLLAQRLALGEALLQVMLWVCPMSEEALQHLHLCSQML